MFLQNSKFITTVLLDNRKMCSDVYVAHIARVKTNELK